MSENVLTHGADNTGANQCAASFAAAVNAADGASGGPGFSAAVASIGLAGVKGRIYVLW